MAPQVRANPSNVVIVREGESATLACDVVKGSPQPEITWTRKVRNIQNYAPFKALLDFFIVSMSTYNINIVDIFVSLLLLLLKFLESSRKKFIEPAGRSIKNLVLN